MPNAHIDVLSAEQAKRLCVRIKSEAVDAAVMIHTSNMIKTRSLPSIRVRPPVLVASDHTAMWHLRTGILRIQ